MNSTADLDAVGTCAFELLSSHHQILVLAESCTAGLIAATLSRVPGMSKCLAGSLVVYQSESKIAWLEIPADLIGRRGVVSAEVAQLMAQQALRKTPHASIAISITGHLGPDAPAELDGVAWLGFADKDGTVLSKQLKLAADEPGTERAQEQEAQVPGSPNRSVRATDVGVLMRHARQTDAVIQALEYLCDRLRGMT